MSVINQNYMVSLEEAAQLIAAVPENRFDLRGEPGIGKSTLIKRISELSGITRCAYVDVPNLDLGDTGMPVLNHETQTTGYYPNERFELHSGEPVLIMLDEFSKGMLPVRNMLHPLLEEHKPRFGNKDVPKGSIVLMTGNLSTDGVGDSDPAHTIGRKSTLFIRKPSAEEWIMNFAIPNDLDAGLVAFVHENPRIMASYVDPDQTDNPYIFHPTKVQGAYASPRSLSRASNILKRRKNLSHNAVMASLAGTVGLATANDLEAFIHYQDSLPPRDTILDDPKNARLPDAGAACYVLVFNLVMLVDDSNINSIITYVNRLPTEFQSVFFLQVAKNKDKQRVAFKNQMFRDWLLANEDLL